MSFRPCRSRRERCSTLYGHLCPSRRYRFFARGESRELFFAGAMNLPRDGDLVEITARTHVFVPDSQTAQVIKATTQEIVILKSKETVENPQSNRGTFRFRHRRYLRPTSHLILNVSRTPSVGCDERGSFV